MNTLWQGARRGLVFAATVALPLLAGTWGGWSSFAATPAPNEVVIDDSAFSPTAITVPRGTKVTWVNKDYDPHTVVDASDAKRFKSPALDTDETFSFTFSEAGTFQYFCTIHPRMQGTVVVQ